MSEINFKNSDYPEDVFHKVTDLLFNNIKTIKTIETLSITNNVPKKATKDIKTLNTLLTKLNSSLNEYINNYNAKHPKSSTQMTAKPIFEYTNITNDSKANI